MTPTPRVLRFYFDYISSNAHLAWLELPALAAKHDARIEPVPVLFAGLLEAHGQLGPAEIGPKARWMWRDNQRKAALLNVPLNVPAFHPFNPLLALRFSSLALGEDERAALISALFQAVWVRGLHVSEPDVVARVAGEVGLDGEALVREAGTAETKALLRRQTDDAISAGVFGVPSMRVGDEIFWGYDDFRFLDLHLAGEDPLERVPPPPDRSRPFQPSAVRRRFR